MSGTNNHTMLKITLGPGCVLYTVSYMPYGLFTLEAGNMTDSGNREWLGGLSLCAYDQKIASSGPGLGRTVTCPWVLTPPSCRGNAY